MVIFKTKLAPKAILLHGSTISFSSTQESDSIQMRKGVGVWKC